ncbi:MAG: DUF4405 domain-containing protein [Pseudodesulfovibrio sp.]|jgi:hypothetical protein|uniref:Uncharacterized protein DUF4405 n=1 Tax=Pseudodesulfovibrio indicus TaxID=1716143 RepID=A0A126QKW1_9BACT|nr:DUF4405 domain-containing protein [Pseudodesulfovibrio indicus]AMK10642.1 hypothetical protein AWY79_05705 [Pseudodesulfovibrio indicus]TDT91614.1 uncharacterized protein DUF4405 [Pseudodesulfovibrio indicus]
MFRKITSLTAFLSFIVTLFTSVILYIVPEGRVAYWADWHLLGLTKSQWGDTHITVGVLFIVALLLHIWLNWKPLMAYMKNRAREMVVMTAPMIVSFVLTFVVFAGTLAGLPPMRQILDFSASIKDAATETYGNPPYGHAETSPLKKFCGFLGLDVNKALEALRAAGYDPSINENTLVMDIARSKGVSPQQVYDVIRGGQGADPFSMMPPQPPEGTGKMTIATVCKTYGLDMAEVLARLEAKGVTADAGSTFKELAETSGVSPKELYLYVRGE